MQDSQMIEQCAREVKMLILDVDGVLTNGDIYIGQEGELYKQFNVKDGLGIKLLQFAGIEIAIITGRKSTCLENRCKELGITQLHQDQKMKVPAFNQLLAKFDLKPEQVAYMGDDLPDLPILKRVGLPTCPQNAVDEVKAVVKAVAPFNGGDGAVRWLAETILKSQGRWQQFIEMALAQ